MSVWEITRLRLAYSAVANSARLHSRQDDTASVWWLSALLPRVRVYHLKSNSRRSISEKEDSHRYLTVFQHWSANDQRYRITVKWLHSYGLYDFPLPFRLKISRVSVAYVNELARMFWCNIWMARSTRYWWVWIFHIFMSLTPIIEGKGQSIGILHIFIWNKNTTPTITYCI